MHISVGNYAIESVLDIGPGGSLHLGSIPGCQRAHEPREI